MSTMLAATYASFGEPAETIEQTAVALPEPGPGQVRVRLRLSPIHNHDLIIARGKYGFKPALPAIGGTEALGIVDKLGAGVDGFAVGQRVVTGGTMGAWADMFIAEEAALIPIPDELPDELAAQIVSMPVSALMALDRIDAKPGEWIVLNAANGAVGKVITQVATSRGVHVAGIVSREAARADLKTFGIDAVVSSAEEGWQAQLEQAIGEGRVAGAIDMIGGEQAGDLLHLISSGGKFLSFGLLSLEKLRLDAADLIYKELVIEGFWGQKVAERTTPEQLVGLIGELVSLGVAGKLRLPVAGVYPLRDSARAAAAASTSRIGKILIRAND